MAPRFFATAADFRAWLAAHHATATELVVGFHKRGSGLPSMTWSESVDEALCVGWIDGVRASLGPQSYRIRFTPRKPGSVWSAVNIAKVATLEAEGRMTDAGRAAWAHRRPERSAVYAYEQTEPARLSPADEAAFRQHADAWRWFEAQAPSWRQRMLHRIASAARPETRERRLQQLIDAARTGRRL